MSKGGWAKLRKQQQHQQESTQIQSDDDGTYQVHNKYKKVIIPKQQQQLNIGAHPHIPYDNTTLPTTSPPSCFPTASPLSTAISPPPRDSILPVDQANSVRASKLLRIVQRWKALSAKSRSPPSSTASSPRSVLNRVPLSCFSSSSFQSSASDHEEDGDADDVDIPSDSTSLKSPKIPTSSPRHNQITRSAKAQRAADQPQSSCQPQYTGKERVDSSCEREIWHLSQRTLSCPKLINYPLRSCTPLPIHKHGKSGQEEEESKSLYPKKEDAVGRSGSTKLRRSSSSPLTRFSASKEAVTPKGYLALYVGKERKRFLVRANVVNHPMFSVLLEKAKEEFGFDQKGALNIPCDIAFFEHIMLLVESNHKS